MTRRNWMQAGVFAGIVLIIFICGVTILPLLFGGYGGWGMMGPGMMVSESSGDWCPFCGGTGRFPGGFFGGMFGWLFVLVAMLFPLGLLVLLILGIVWLVRTTSRPQGGIAPSPRECPSCGQPVAGDWHHCPQCGADV